MSQVNPPLPDDTRDWQRREPFIRRFEAAWLRGERPRIDDHLPSNGTDRGAVLFELIHADLECRLKAGDAVRIESYLDRYPELMAAPSVILDLIVAEFDLRRRSEPGLDSEAYLQRFPQFRTELASRWRAEAETRERAAAPQLPAIPGYAVQGFLARGGMGAVYQARQQRLDRVVALKVLASDHAEQPNFVERFGREARALARLNHPHVIAVHDFGEASGQCYLVMEFVDGQDLRQLLRAGKLRPDVALRIAGQMAEALQYAHEEGVIHRDVKPENVLLDKKGRVKVADFGLAKLRTDRSGVVPLTGSQQVVGTLHYMAPEQLRRPQEVDARADVYALGVVLYEMLTGELPLGRFAPPSQVPGVDRRLDAILFRMLDQEPEKRFASIAEVQAALTRLVAPVAQVEAEVAPPTLNVLPLRFFLCTFGTFLLGWLLTAAAANHGLEGLVLAGVVMAALASATTIAAVVRLPELRQELRRRRRSLAVLNTSLALVLGMLGLGALVAAHYAWWDRPVLEPSGFVSLHRGQEHRLLQQLAAFQKKASELPEVEMVTLHASFSAQDKLASWLLLSGSLLVLGAALLSLEAARGRNTWLLHWQPALVLTAAILLPMPVLQVLAGTVGKSAELPEQSGVPGIDTTLVKSSSRRLSFPTSLEQVVVAVRRWAEDYDYDVQLRGSWALETLRDRHVLVRVLWLEARSRSVFDRWRLTWHGHERRRPLLRIQCLCSVDPPEALVTLDPGPFREGAAEPDGLRAILDALQGALETSR